MTEYELLRIISFLEKIRAPYDEGIGLARPDAYWNILLCLMKATLKGEAITKSTLAQSANIPFPSAMRKISQLIEEGVILEVPKRQYGSSYVLKPSQCLRDDFSNYASKIKVLLAATFGLGVRSSTDPEEYYFGGSYMEGQVIPPLKLIENRSEKEGSIRFLLHDDNYFASMSHMWTDFRSGLSARSNFKFLRLPALREEILENSAQAESSYDIVAINVPWLGEMSHKSIVRPLDDLIKDSGINQLDFHPDIWATGTWSEMQFGVPIYSTIETLNIRKDLFDEHNLPTPGSFEKVLEAAAKLHQPKRGISGIVWDAARGMPVASSFMFFMACCGGGVLNVPSSKLFLDYSRLDPEMYRPRVDSVQGLEALSYMHRLIKYSPPDILQTHWNSALERFLNGSAAMIYCWTMRAARFEYDIRSTVKRKVEYLPLPHGSRGPTLSPVGGFLLAIPKNVSPERAQLAFDAISWMTSPAAMKEHVKNGFPVAPRFSVAADPEAAATTPIVRMVDRLAKQNKLHRWPRPPIPEYALIERILGDLIFAALSGDITDREALARSQTEIDQVMRNAGYY
ncbi:extracellular solute-binding protein [Ensifer adhaerens]|uniref:extracellular solute-binding protein n=1 Tax=Ensifer adhaerens TaxID=106592 RepID=UPI001CBF0EAE|nr:extracellular solute-binding protein [Ensifer adhaerens]MBZ7924207.1 extracellular solute-binding protein [Ensifer adhaerens]UAX96537.1 extracellular solute-binding protein [Ensifer adhaerens]UAY04119.1 extracellular solute-binding protein [Ensifer adhaerens]UAY12105.1 extracellular solute-binding protein [Ensifer adhaerens]